MLKFFTAALLGLVTLFSGVTLAAEATHSVSEDIYVYMLRGPSTQYKIIGSVKAGEGLTLTGETQGDYTRVSDTKGRSGWLRTDQIQPGDGFRVIVPALKEKLTQSEEQVASLTIERDGLQQKNQELTGRLEQQFGELNGRIDAQANQLAEIQKHNDALTAENNELKMSERFIWMKQGGMVAGVGVLVGLIIAYLPRPKRRRQRDGWS